MIESVATGFMWVFRLILAIIGGAAAVILFALALLILALVAGVIFNLVTELMARHWEKTGKRPRNKLGQIIMRRREYGADSEV